MFQKHRVSYLTVSFRMIAVLTLLCGVVYPLAVTGVGELFMSDHAEGSLLKDADGEVRGSRLLAQNYTDSSGVPLPQYFQPRPSVSGWDALASGGSNLGPNSEELEQNIQLRRSEYAALNAGAGAPVDALTASASGLDPHISWENAQAQAARVARERGLPLEAVQQHIEQASSIKLSASVSPRLVNTTVLNFELDQLEFPVR